MRELLKSANAHFEAIFLGWMWLNASALSVIVGKPWLGCIGLVTVLPALSMSPCRRTVSWPMEVASTV